MLKKYVKVQTVLGTYFHDFGKQNGYLSLPCSQTFTTATVDVCIKFSLHYLFLLPSASSPPLWIKVLACSSHEDYNLSFYFFFFQTSLAFCFYASLCTVRAASRLCFQVLVPNVVAVAFDITLLLCYFVLLPDRSYISIMFMIRHSVP